MEQLTIFDNILENNQDTNVGNEFKIELQNDVNQKIEPSTLVVEIDKVKSINELPTHDTYIPLAGDFTPVVDGVKIPP